MRVVIQRVKRASVGVGGVQVGAIRHGLLVFLGIEETDANEDVLWLVQKITQMRIFSDTEGKMNLDLMQARGQILVVSQFTLHASTKKGNRPSFIRAARPEAAMPLYKLFLETCRKINGLDVQEGQFGAMMDVELINDGPVTICMDSKAKE